MLVADTERDRHRGDAADDGSPEGVDELFVVAEEEDEFVAAAGTDPLQVIQNAERALMQLGVGNIARVVLAFQVRDGPGGVAVGLEKLGQGRCFQHQRRSSLICKG